RRPFHAFVGRMSGEAGDLLVAAGVVAGQAIDLVFGREVETVVLPAVAHMAGLAEGFVRLVADAEAVEHGFLAQLAAVYRVLVLPGPVAGGHHLLGGLGVTGQTGAGDLLAAGKWPLQFLELAVVRCGGQCGAAGPQRDADGECRSPADDCSHGRLLPYRYRRSGQAVPPPSSPISSVVALSQACGGISRLVGAGWWRNTRPARSKIEPWQGHRKPP